MEIWKQITNKHEVSNLGKIRNIKTKRILKTWLINGYESILLTCNKKNTYHLISRLVLSTFTNTNHPDLVVNHIDGNKLNNNLSNLEWCTQKENLYHSRNITKNGSVISHQKIKHLYNKNKDIKLDEFVNLLLDNCK